MATPSKIVIPAHRTVVGTAMSGVGQTPQAAAEVSRLLQENHDNHHIFFNEEGFHNHIVHHMLALYSFGASAEWLKKGYENNTSYQRKAMTADDKVVNAMDDGAFKENLAKEDKYVDYLRYFQKEMDKAGDWRDVVKKYLFEDTELAKDMLERLFAGFLHPFIHLGYGLEHEQPAIVAEALAQTAVHDNWPAAFLNTCDEKGKESTKTLVELVKECAERKELQGAAKFSDPQKNKGLMSRAGDAMIEIASQWGVYDEKELEEKMAEVVNLCGYITGAAQRPDKEIKMDFFLMHCINSSIWLSTFISQPWIPAAAKMKIVTWHGRLAVNMYVSRGNPKLNINEVSSYVPRESSLANPWLGVIDRAIRFPDDGHTVKFIRACANGERVTRGYEDKKGFVLVGDMWVKLANMVIDSSEAKGETWVRSTGFDEAWKGFGARKEYKGKL